MEIGFFFASRSFYFVSNVSSYHKVVRKYQDPDSMRQTLCCCPSSIYTEIAAPFLDVPQFLMAFIRPLELAIPNLVLKP